MYWDRGWWTVLIGRVAPGMTVKASELPSLLVSLAESDVSYKLMGPRARHGDQETGRWWW